MILLLTGIAGALGAVLRYGVDAALGRLHTLPLPIGTWTINVTGSLALGVLSGWQLPADLVAVLGTGLCGGFTTFSTASVEAVRLAGQPLIAAGYVLATLVSCVGAVALGQALVG